MSFNAKNNFLSWIMFCHAFIIDLHNSEFEDLKNVIHILNLKKIGEGVGGLR
jgi:hypothetical protein